MWTRRAWCLMTVLALGQGVVWSPGVAAAAPTASAAGASSAGSSASPAAETWGPVHRFERNVSGRLVADARGVTTVVWTSLTTWPHTIKLASRAAQGGWGPARTLGVGSDPVIAADRQGTLTVAWTRERSGHTTGVWAARKPVGRPWSKPTHVSVDRPLSGSAYGAADLDVAVSPRGAALVTWVWGRGTAGIPFRIQAAHRAAGGTWGPVVAVTPPADALAPLAAFAPDGRAWVAWDRTPADGPTSVKARSRAPDGTWTATRRVAVGNLGGLGVSKQGKVTIAFRDRVAIRVVIGPRADGSWPPATRLTAPGSRIEEWSFATNPAGAAIVAYAGASDRVFVLRRSVAGAWTSPLQIGEPPGSLWVLTASVNPRGDMFVSWGAYGIWARYRPVGGGWHGLTTVQPDAGVDVLEAIDSRVTPSGDAVLLYEQEERALRARVLDVG